MMMGLRRVSINVARYSGLLICAIAIFIFIVLFIWPVSGSHFYNSGEIPYAARLAISARNELALGHFPLAYANDYDVALQPIFLLYTPVFYTLAGLCQILTGADAYNSLLIVVCLLTAIAVCGVYRTIRVLGVGPIPAALAAAALPFTPYYITDMYVRASYAEMSAWAALTWVMFFFVRFCLNNEFKNGLGLILSTAIMIMCHKIFLGWSLVALALLALALLGARRALRIIPGLAVCLLAALALSAPYWLNAALLANALKVSGTFAQISFAHLTYGMRIFSLFPETHPSLIEQYRRLDLQLGPVVTVALAAGIYFLPRQNTLRAFWIVTVFTALFCCSFFGVRWIWDLLPAPLRAIQFPYRMLLLGTTFGIVLAGLVLSSIFERSKSAAYVVVASVALLVANSYWVSIVTPENMSVLPNIRSPIIGDVYFETGGVAPPAGTKVTATGRSAIKVKGDQAAISVNVESPGFFSFPIQYSRNLSAGNLLIYNDKGLVALDLAAGSHAIDIRRDEPIGFAASIMVALFAIGLLFVISTSRSRSARTVLVTGHA